MAKRFYCSPQIGFFIICPGAKKHPLGLELPYAFRDGHKQATASGKNNLGFYHSTVKGERANITAFFLCSS